MLAWLLVPSDCKFRSTTPTTSAEIDAAFETMSRERPDAPWYFLRLLKAKGRYVRSWPELT
jgi:hypothetical protein